MRHRDYYIPIPECKARWVYRIDGRNIKFGVFDPKHSSFIGIRTKWDDRFLDDENHWDCPTFATVMPLEALEEIPEDIIVEMSLGTVDEVTRRPVDFDRPVKDGGKGWYFTDTNESDQNIRAVSISNKKLFEYLDDVAKRFTEPESCGDFAFPKHMVTLGQPKKPLR